MDPREKTNASAGGQWREHTRVIDTDREVKEDLRGSPVLLGFACDEGVRRNHGRPGSKKGPEAIRNALARLAWHHPGELLDGGDVTCNGEDLENAQTEFGRKIGRLLEGGGFPVGIGGGHEIAFGHYTGIRHCIGDAKLGIINFDAHFDMRIPVHNQGNSGTSFFQIARHCQENQLPFHYLCLGIQKENNTRVLFDTATEHQAQWIEAMDAHIRYREAVGEQLDRFLEQSDHVYLSFCLDVFNASVAPGVSAVNPLGLYPETVLDLTRHIAGSGKVVSVDLAELNPLYDIDQRTARLAAALIFHVLQWR